MAEFGESRLENVVEYKIFSFPSTDAQSKTNIDVTDTLYEVLSYAQSLIGEYIWHNECFHLECQELQHSKEIEQTEKIRFLEGSTNFGDNIEDEWFIVYLLFNITKQFPYFVATVSDNDGEFLLIEAADYLPTWLEPETSENRVFIHQGILHIIPLPRKPSEVTVFPVEKPTIDRALKILKMNSEETMALPWIQDPIVKKIHDFSKKPRDCFHHVLSYVPAEVKYLLERKRSLISPAVSAFVHRDPVEMKTCLKQKHFSLDSLVPHRVCFTKFLYGQLVKQNFVPGKFASKHLPSISSPTYKGHLIGLQVTYGFEIMCSQRDGYVNEEAMPSSPCGQVWKKYLESLTKHGYFQNEVVGSVLYMQLLESAKEYFTKISLGQRQTNSNEIKKLLEEMPAVDSAQPIPIQFPPDDDESWLELSAQKLDSILSEYGQPTSSAGKDVDLKEIVSGVNSFVETISSYEGAEFPSELSEEVQFDPDGFMHFFTNPRDENTNTSDDDLHISDLSDSDEQMSKYTTAMDKELSATNIGKSFVEMQEGKDTPKSSEDDISATSNVTEEMKPLDIDLNLVQNFLESYSSQEGLPGPVSNILRSMGINLPENLPQSDEK